MQADTPSPMSAEHLGGGFRKGGRRPGPGMGRVDRGEAKGGCQERLGLGSIPLYHLLAVGPWRILSKPQLLQL